MIVLVALATGLVIWIAAWAVGVKSLDAFLVTVVLVVGAATVRVLAPAIARFKGRHEPAG